MSGFAQAKVYTWSGKLRNQTHSVLGWGEVSHGIQSDRTKTAKEFNTRFLFGYIAHCFGLCNQR